MRRRKTYKKPTQIGSLPKCNSISLLRRHTIQELADRGRMQVAEKTLLQASAPERMKALRHRKELL